MPCNHKFQGDKDGVQCLLCGMHMTPKEYAKYLNPSAPDAPKEPTGGPQAEPAPKKPRAKSKQKEKGGNRQ